MASDDITGLLNFAEILRPIKRSRRGMILPSLETSESGYPVTQRNNPVERYGAAKTLKSHKLFFLQRTKFTLKFLEQRP